MRKIDGFKANEILSERAEFMCLARGGQVWATRNAPAADALARDLSKGGLKASVFEFKEEEVKAGPYDNDRAMVLVVFN